MARLQAEIDNFLAVRGLNVKASKTRVADMKGGFDFLGLNFFLKPNGSSPSKPKRDWLTKTKATIRNLIKSRLPQDELKRKLLRITEGKRRFYQYSDLSKVNGEWWKLRQFVYASIGVVIPSLVYHRNYISVKGSKSPFDGDWVYWVQRNNKRYQGNIRFNVLKRQQGKCGLCGLYLTEVAEVHLHHLDGDHSKARIQNLQLVHRACHMNHHRTLAMTQRQSPTPISRMQ